MQQNRVLKSVHITLHLTWNRTQLGSRNKTEPIAISGRLSRSSNPLLGHAHAQPWCRLYIELQRFLNLRYCSTGGETYYPVDYENIFYQIFFVYLRAESHNKVATIIFYFAKAVSHAAVQTDRLCYI